MSTGIVVESTVKATAGVWSYRQSFVFGAILAVIGLLMEFSGVRIPKIPAFPINVYLGIFFLNLLLIGYFQFRIHPVVKWLMSVPASVSAIAFYTCLVILMGFIPQESQSTGWISRLGFDNILTSWPFLIIQLFFMATLGMVTLKRTFPFKSRNIGFILNHLGLWLIIFAVALGTGDFKRLTMPVVQGHTAMTAYDKNGVGQELSFAVELVNFDIEEYPVKAVLVKKPSGKITATSFMSLDSGFATFALDHWQIDATSMSETAEDNGSDNLSFHVKAKNGSATVEGILAIENRTPAFLVLNNGEALALLPPEPKRYISNVNVSDGRVSVNRDVLVNKPAAFGGWKIYQVSYDETAGKNSSYSVFEVIKDPWLPLVYVGLIMLIMGAFYLMWFGNKAKV
jgi:hypothetical protein